jgi:hypothetical protein
MSMTRRPHKHENDRGPGYIFVVVMSLVLLCAGYIDGYSQVDADEFAPPPMKAIPKADRESLEREKDDRSRTRSSLEMMSNRIKSAESLAASGDLDGMFREMGIFHALMDDALAHLRTRDRKNSRTLDNFKRLEIGFRSFVPRIEGIRRELPLTHEKYVSLLLQYVRQARAKASDALFSDTVIPGLVKS